ncbi:hypothetical protein H257_10480 [Aphanomyces astaci]|uniref:CCHC-type domain-containing protein n=1 Tax=Aphanomyces astaci TaxID=112090 RepID=W4G6G0_APHAT|nr:hypothetical protein H257_10480 [Aphanomyces astaci]ETV75297.1 hypothetical protein H257_10480 [Aphanomyces astaci]|eukprot:XP_009835345.1 hypothetical protein H257_10480 [Aphanomyces astaci]
MAEITQNSIRKAKETVREYAWRINDAAQDLELRHSQAAQIFIDGCKDPGLASCIRGSETRPGTIQECLDYLRFRDMDLDMRLNDANGHDVPRSTSSATRVNRTNSTDATSKSTEEAMAALRWLTSLRVVRREISRWCRISAWIPTRRRHSRAVWYVGVVNEVVMGARRTPGDRRCYNCNEPGHLRVECPKLRSGPSIVVPPNKTSVTEPTNTPAPANRQQRGENYGQRVATSIRNLGVESVGRQVTRVNPVNRSDVEESVSAGRAISSSRDEARLTHEQLVLSGRSEGSTRMSDPVGDVRSVELPVPGEGSESSLDEANMDCDEDSPLEEAEYEEVIRVGSMDMPSHEVDTEDDVAGSPVEEGYSHDGSMRTLGRVGYALEVEVSFPTEVIRGEPAVEQAPLESHDQYKKSVVDSVASSEARAVRVDLPVQGAASTAGGYTDLPHSTVVESQVTGPEKLTLPSVNDPSVRWVFTPHQIEAIVRCDFPGIVQGLHSDMEDRMLPLTKADVAD